MNTLPSDTRPPPSVPGERLAGLGLVLWVALLGADRVDLLGGSAGFILTPFLAFTPVFLALEGMRVGLFRLPVRPPDRRAAGYTLGLVLLVCVALISSLVGVDVATSAKRSLHLIAISGGTLVVAMAFVHRPWTRRSLATGAEVGLVLAVLFNVAQVWFFLSGGTLTSTWGPASVALEPGMYAGVVPRLTGQVADPNRAGLLFLFYVFALVRGREPGARRRLGVAVGSLLLLLTISRSAVLAGLAAATVALVASRGVRASRALVLVPAVATAGLALLFLVRPAARTDLTTLLHPLSSRFSLREGSTREHAYLLSRGLHEATVSVPRAAIGMGYGDSFTALQDVFPGNKYGNFHSIYVTLLAESGVFALLLAVILLGYPVIRPGPYLPMVVALWVFDFFYQAAAEPTFWFVLALAWLTIPMARGERSARAGSGRR